MAVEKKGVRKVNWYGFLIFVIIVLILPWLGLSSFIITQATFTGIYAIVAVGHGLLMGYAGQICLAQAALYGVGAYTTAVVSKTFGLSPWIGLLFAILLPALIAYIVGHTMARLSGYYLAMATLAFGIIVSVLLVEWRSVTSGASGFYGIPSINLFGMTINQGVSYYYFVWFFAIIAVLIALNIVHSRIGRALRSIHDSEIAASSMGVNTGKYKMQIFVLSAMLAGLAGWLFAHMSYSIAPGSFGLDASILFLTMVVLGGSTSIWGALIGTVLIIAINVFVHFLGNTVSFITSDFEHVMNGLILILVIMFMPKGLFPTLADFIRNKLSKTPDPAEEITS